MKILAKLLNKEGYITAIMPTAAHGITNAVLVGYVAGLMMFRITRILTGYEILVFADRHEPLTRGRQVVDTWQEVLPALQHLIKASQEPVMA